MSASTTAFKRLLFPTLLRPTKATSGTSDSGTSRKYAALMRSLGGFRLLRKKLFAAVLSPRDGGSVSQYQWKLSWIPRPDFTVTLWELDILPLDFFAPPKVAEGSDGAKSPHEASLLVLLSKVEGFDGTKSSDEVSSIPRIFCALGPGVLARPNLFRPGRGTSLAGAST